MRRYAFARRPVGPDQGYSAGPRRPCRRCGGGQSPVRRSRSLQVSSRRPVAGSARALRRLEDRLSALQPMGQERRFRAGFQAPGQRSRQRMHEDRRHHRARSTSIAPAPKKEGAQAIGRSRGGATTKIHALVDALGNPVEVMLSPGQDHDLTCAESLIAAVDPA